MSKHFYSFVMCTMVFGATIIFSSEAYAQRGGGRGGGGGGGRSGGHSSPKPQGRENAGPAMQKPKGPSMGNGPSARPSGPGGQAGGGERSRPNEGAGQNQRPNNGFQRPSPGNGAGGNEGLSERNRPNAPGANTPGANERPNSPGRTDRPNAAQRPNATERPNAADRPNAATRPGGGASSSQLNDFLGISDRSGARVGNTTDVNRQGNVAAGNRTQINKNDVAAVGNRNVGNTNINVGNVNIGNSADFSKDQNAWIANNHVAGDQVRVNAGNRYNAPYVNGAYRQGAVGGYDYHAAWNARGPYYGWSPVSYAAVGTFVGVGLAAATPKYYAYGSGGNVYYENNVVYVDGKAAGTPQEYAAQSTALIASAPEQVDNSEWLPLGTFAVSREGVEDSHSMVELAINKQGVLAGTYYNESTQVSRSLKGMLDPASQKVAIGFADGKNTTCSLETGIQNLTQDEAPALLHHGKDQSTPVLMVRLQPPADSAGQ